MQGGFIWQVDASSAGEKVLLGTSDHELFRDNPFIQ